MLARPLSNSLHFSSCVLLLSFFLFLLFYLFIFCCRTFVDVSRQSVAIDPDYPKVKKNVFVTGGMAGNLVYNEDKPSVLKFLMTSTKQKVVRLSASPPLSLHTCTCNALLCSCTRGRGRSNPSSGGPTLSRGPMTLGSKYMTLRVSSASHMWNDQRTVLLQSCTAATLRGRMIRLC